MPKLKLGAVFYGLIAVAGIVSAVLVFHGYGPYAGADGWYLLGRGTVFMLIGVMFGIGAVTRRGLVADHGPRICRSGWIVLAALLGAEFVVYSLGDDGWGNFPSIATVLIPPWIKRCQEKYYEGVEEAERELNPEGPAGGQSPTV